MTTIEYSTNKMGVVEFVLGKLHSLKPDSALTTIIKRGKSGDYYVTSVTEGSSEDIEALPSLKQPTNT